MDETEVVESEATPPSPEPLFRFEFEASGQVVHPDGTID